MNKVQNTFCPCALENADNDLNMFITSRPDTLAYSSSWLGRDHIEESNPTK